VLLRGGSVSEVAGRFNHDFRADLSPWKICWITFRENRDSNTVNDDCSLFCTNRNAEAAQDAVIFQEVGKSLSVSEIIYADYFNCRTAFPDCPKKIAPNATETINTDLHGDSPNL